jgi:hypothetical protein
MGPRLSCPQIRIRFPEDKGVRRPKKPDQPRRLTGPAGRGSGCGLTALDAVSAVSATLPRPRGLAPRLPGGILGTLVAVGRPRAPQAYSSLGRAVHHRQDFEARNIQAGQRSRRGLQQRLEHPTTTSLLPLRCFKLFIFLVFSSHTQIKSNRQGRVSLASAKPDPPSRARRGEPPLRQNFPRKRSFARTSFALFDCFDSGVLKTTGVHISGKADRAEGLLRLRDTNTSLITFREK